MSTDIEVTENSASIVVEEDTSIGVSVTGGADTRALEAVTTVTSDYTMTIGDVVLADASNNAITVTLPAVTSRVVGAVKVVDATNDVTIATPNSETIDGESSRTITAKWVSRTIASDGTNYFII